MHSMCLPSVHVLAWLVCSTYQPPNKRMRVQNSIASEPESMIECTSEALLLWGVLQTHCMFKTLMVQSMRHLKAGIGNKKPLLPSLPICQSSHDTHTCNCKKCYPPPCLKHQSLARSILQGATSLTSPTNNLVPANQTGCGRVERVARRGIAAVGNALAMREYACMYTHACPTGSWGALQSYDSPILPAIESGDSKGVLAMLGLPNSLVRNVIMSRDIVPRAFACDYSLDDVRRWKQVGVREKR
eukprot:822964-Pelagomonas_calceolata.AAC.8